MYKKSFAIALSLLLLLSIAGCARKHVRHLASDVSLVTPGTTTKQKVVNYLGEPNAVHKMDGGGLLWVYYEEKSSMLHGTPYIGEKIGEEIFEVVKITFIGDIVQTIVYKTMDEEDFVEAGFSE